MYITLKSSVVLKKKTIKIKPQSLPTCQNSVTKCTASMFVVSG